MYSWDLSINLLDYYRIFHNDTLGFIEGRYLHVDVHSIIWGVRWARVDWSTRLAMLSHSGELFARSLTLERPHMRLDGHTEPLYCRDAEAFFVGFADILLHVALEAQNPQEKIQLCLQAQEKLREANNYGKDERVGHFWSSRSSIAIEVKKVMVEAQAAQVKDSIERLSSSPLPIATTTQTQASKYKPKPKREREEEPTVNTEKTDEADLKKQKLSTPIHALTCKHVLPLVGDSPPEGDKQMYDWQLRNEIIKDSVKVKIQTQEHNGVKEVDYHRSTKSNCEMQSAEITVDAEDIPVNKNHRRFVSSNIRGIGEPGQVAKKIFIGMDVTKALTRNDNSNTSKQGYISNYNHTFQFFKGQPEQTDVEMADSNQSNLNQSFSK